MSISQSFINDSSPFYLEGIDLPAYLLEPGEIDHFESARNDQSRLIRNSQCTSMTN